MTKEELVQKIVNNLSRTTYDKYTINFILELAKQGLQTWKKIELESLVGENNILIKKKRSKMPEITVKITWDKPKDTNWLNPDNVALALNAYCRNTKFEVKEK